MSTISRTPREGTWFESHTKSSVSGQQCSVLVPSWGIEAGCVKVCRVLITTPYSDPNWDNPKGKEPTACHTSLGAVVLYTWNSLSVTADPTQMQPCCTMYIEMHYSGCVATHAKARRTHSELAEWASVYDSHLEILGDPILTDRFRQKKLFQSSW